MIEFNVNSAKNNDDSSSWANLLPREEANLSKSDKVALYAFTVAATALFGPEAGIIAQWWGEGGGLWVGNAILSVLPEGWKAKGGYTWIDSVIEPGRARAIDVDRTIERAARDAYRLLLEEKGLVNPNDRTPDKLLWKNVRKGIQGTEYLKFSEYARDKARELGYGTFRDVYLGKGAYIKLWSEEECRKLQGGSISYLPYCVKLQGISNRPDKGEPERVAKAYAFALNTYRLQPKMEGLRQALHEAERAIDALPATYRMPHIVPSTPTQPNASPSWIDDSVSPGWIGGESEIADAINRDLNQLDSELMLSGLIDCVNSTADAPAPWSTYRDAWPDWYNTEEAIPDDILSRYRYVVDTFRGAFTECANGGTQPALPIPPGPSTGKMTDADARAVLLRIWATTTGEEASLPELQIAQAIGRFEGRYGFKSDGTQHNNWGGVQCAKGPPCAPDCFEYGDTHGDGTAYRWCLRRYPTPDAGASDMVRLITIKRPSVWAAMRMGDAGLVASEMRRTGYHETAVGKYRDAIVSNAKSIAKALGEPLQTKKTGTATNKGTIVPIVAVALIATLALSKKGRKR